MNQPFFSNYDLYDTEGVNGKAKGGPGTGIYSGKDKSFSQFRSRKSKARKKLLKDMVRKAGIKLAIDFDSDQNIHETEIIGDSGSVADSNLGGGLLDDYTQSTDSNSIEPTTPGYAENLDINEPNDKEYAAEPVVGAEPGLFGSQENFSNPEDLDADALENAGSHYGITDSGNLSYQHLW
jgi:hypothetical protein